MDHEIPKLDPAFTSELKRIIAERDAHCPRCKYNLSGIAGPRCPECGKNIAAYLRIADTNPARLPEHRRKALLRLLARRAAILTLVAATITSLAWGALALAQ